MLAKVAAFPDGTMPRRESGGAFFARWAMFKFTIRELGLVTVIVAMGLAWWTDRTLLLRRAAATGWHFKNLVTLIEAEGWEVSMTGANTAINCPKRGLRSMGAMNQEIPGRPLPPMLPPSN